MAFEKVAREIESLKSRMRPLLPLFRTVELMSFSEACRRTVVALKGAPCFDLTYPADLDLLSKEGSKLKELTVAWTCKSPGAGLEEEVCKTSQIHRRSINEVLISPGVRTMLEACTEYVTQMTDVGQNP